MRLCPGQERRSHVDRHTERVDEYLAQRILGKEGEGGGREGEFSAFLSPLVLYLMYDARRA